MGAQESRSKLLSAGTLLFSFKLTIGKMAIAGVDLYTNEAIAGLLPKRPDETLREFLRFALNSIDLVSGSAHAVKGKTLNQDSLNALEVPLPPFTEQKRIAAILNEQMAAVERARAAAEAQLEAAKALPAAYLRAVFNSPEAKQWPKTNVGSVASLVIDGPHVTPAYQSNGIPFLTVRNIVNRRIDLTNVSFISVTDHAEFARRGRAECGDILYTNDGTLGIPCVVDVDTEFSFFVSVALIKFPRDRVLPQFIAFALESPQVVEQVKSLGAGAGLKHMVLKSIRVLEVPLPSLAEQQRVAARLSEQMADAERTRQALEAQLATINVLPAALLRRAFNGEL